MTLNGYFTLNSVFVHVRLDLFCMVFGNNICIKTDKVRSGAGCSKEQWWVRKLIWHRARFCMLFSTGFFSLSIGSALDISAGHTLVVDSVVRWLHCFR